MKPQTRGTSYPERSIKLLRPFLLTMGEEALAKTIGLSLGGLARVMAGMSLSKGTHLLVDRFMDSLK